MEKSAPGKIKDLSLNCALQLIAITCHSGLNLKIFLMELRNFLHFNIFLICWLSIKNRALKFSLEFGKINSKWDRHTLKGHDFPESFCLLNPWLLFIKTSVATVWESDDSLWTFFNKKIKHTYTNRIEMNNA